MLFGVHIAKRCIAASIGFQRLTVARTRKSRLAWSEAASVIVLDEGLQRRILYPAQRGNKIYKQTFNLPAL